MSNHPHTALPKPRIRKTFVMAVMPGKADEYFRRHEEMWPELKDALWTCGVRSYSLFYYPTTRQVFCYAEIDDEAKWALLSRDESYLRWCRYMSEIMPSNEDKSPAGASLKEVVHLDSSN